MSGRWFGTDGIRSRFGTPPLDQRTVGALGAVLGHRLAAAGGRAVVLGGDTRASTPTLCRWLAPGLAGAGLELIYLGTVPTPCVAWNARRLGAAAGIAVSASHNPHHDNGIKLIGGDGFKWPQADERALEDALRARLASGGNDTGSAPDAPPLSVDRDAVDAYLASLTAGLPPRALAGLSIALDAANGAAAPYAAALFTGLGATVDLHHAAPDGDNINRRCGSTVPQVVAALTRDGGNDLGFAFDGDADRLIAADERGQVRDGDALLYLWGRALAERGALTGDAVVATTMSNLGLGVALERAGIALVRCDVGDRAVVEALRRGGLRLGGEQSGHLVDLALATTGDGLLSALRIALLRAEAGRPLSALLAGFETYPQLIRNVPVTHKPDLDALPAVVAARRDIEHRLGDAGRLVLRYSGTEPLARIMIEGRERTEIERLAESLAAVIESAVASRAPA